jgi:uncharacterized protein YndB with AHSA1/START domain
MKAHPTAPNPVSRLLFRVTLHILTLEDRGGKTHLISHERYPSKEARAAALESGMEHGMRESLDQLDALVASLR